MKRMKMGARLLVLLLVVVFGLVACAGTSKQASTGEFVDDSVITAKVKAELAKDNAVNLFKIGVETFKGTVQLSGFVDSRQTADKAGRIAAGVKGVRAVSNDLVVK